MLRFSSHNIFKFSIQLVVVILLFSRFLYLDQDVPSYMVSGISQEDESYYSIGGLLRYYNDVGKTDPNFNTTSSDLVCLYSTPLTYLSFHLFGNNYWGLRFGVPFISLIVVFFLFKISCKELKNDSFSKYFLLCFLLSDFYFFTFCRFQTPQIYSILILSFSLFFFYYIKNINKQLFVVSFLAISSILFVYIYNVFFALGVCSYYLIFIINQKNFKLIIPLFLGGITAFILFLITIALLGSTLEDYLNIFITFNSKRSAFSIESNFGISTIIISGLKNLSSVFFTNLFRYNNIWLFFLIFYFTYRFKEIFYKGFKLIKSDLLLVIILCAFFQSIFLNSYPFKKWIVLLPIVFCFGLEFFKKNNNSEKNKSVLISILLTIPLVIYSYKLNYSVNYWNSFNYGYYANLSFFISIIPLLVFGIFSFLILVKSNLKIMYTGFSFCIILMFLIISNVYYINKKFEIRDYLTDIRPLLEGNYLIDGFPHSYSLYTNSVPILNPYSFNSEKYSFDKLYLQYDDKKKYLLFKKMRGDLFFYNKIDSSKLTLLDTKHLLYYDLKLYELK